MMTFRSKIQDILTYSWLENKKSAWIVQDVLSIRSERRDLQFILEFVLINQDNPG